MTETPEVQFAHQTEAASAESSVGVRVQEERLRLQMTQGELAERLGISRTSATLYEAGKHLPRAEVLIGLDGLGADVLYILTGRRRSAEKVDLDIMAFALQEARQQISSDPREISDRECLYRAWPIYLALMNFKRSSLHKPSFTVA